MPPELARELGLELEIQYGNKNYPRHGVKILLEPELGSELERELGLKIPRQASPAI